MTGGWIGQVPAIRRNRIGHIPAWRPGPSSQRIRIYTCPHQITKVTRSDASARVPGRPFWEFAIPGATAAGNYYGFFRRLIAGASNGRSG